MELGGRDKEMGMLSSFSNNKLNRESAAPRTLDHHTETNPGRVPDQHTDPVSAPILLPLSEDGPLIRYRECLKNHAASMGGHVLDGCGEFMPSGEDGTGEALKCAACECHRNFHRKETYGESQYYKNNTRRDTTLHLHPHHQQPTPLRQQRFPLGHGLSNSTTPCLTVAPPLTTNFGGGRVESSSEDLNMFPGGSKKRFRTKFSKDQKDKMSDFAEKLGWRIQKQDEAEVQQFCEEMGFKRRVFKVWMHNSKQAMKRKQM